MSSSRHRKFPYILFSASILFLLASCASTDRGVSKGGASQRPNDNLAEANQRLRVEIDACRQESLRLKISLKSLETSRKGLEKENRVLELRLLEKEAKIKELERKEASLREPLNRGQRPHPI